MSKQNILSILVSAIPLSYILGTFIVNLNILFIIIAGISLFTQGLKFKLLDIDKLIIIFFTLLKIIIFKEKILMAMLI